MNERETPSADDGVECCQGCGGELPATWSNEPDDDLCDECLPGWSRQAGRLGPVHECYACVVGVATGPESHAENCVARNIPMPEQDGQWGPEWDEYDRQVAAARASKAGE